MTTATAPRSLFATEHPSTILFPTVYRGPASTPKRQRPCTPDSTLRDVWERILKPWLITEGTAVSTLSLYQGDLCEWERITSAADFGSGGFGEQGPRVCDISRELLAEVRERLKARSKSVNTANRKMRSINVILGRASRRGPGNPEGEDLSDEWLHLRQYPKTTARKRIASVQQIGDWYTQASGATWPVGDPIPAPLWWRTLLVLYSTYGFRTCDVLKLDWTNVYWSPDCPMTDVVVRNSYGWLMLVPTKTQRKKPDPLVLAMTKQVQAHLLACWMACDKPKSGFIFRCPVGRKTVRSRADGRASWRTIQEDLHDERKWQQRRAGITEPYEFRDLRKMCSTWLGRVGDVGPELRRLVLGHASRDVNDNSYYVGIELIRSNLHRVVLPPQFDQIFRSPDALQQRLMFQAD